MKLSFLSQAQRFAWRAWVRLQARLRPRPSVRAGAMRFEAVRAAQTARGH